MDLFQTLDKSYTLVNPDFNENYHSNAGAWQEARIKYFEACRIQEKCESQSELTIFELGFGLGYNLIPILDYLQSNKSCHITYISSEFDSGIFSELLRKADQLYPQTHIAFFRELLEKQYYSDDHLDIKVLIGDVRQSIDHIRSESLDAIYHDPFSPYKNTECWTLQLFEKYHQKLKDDAILSTYSISTPVRSGLYQAGFYLWQGIGDQTKSSGTLASKSKLDLPELSDHELTKLTQSPERIPFIDTTMKENRDEIKRIRMAKKSAEDFSDLIRR